MSEVIQNINQISGRYIDSVFMHPEKDIEICEYCGASDDKFYRFIVNGQISEPHNILCTCGHSWIS